MANPMQRATNEPLALREVPRCGARTRQGKPCQSPIVNGKRRCRMHGGANGTGAPKGERNGHYRHGFYTAEAIAERQALRALIRELGGSRPVQCSPAALTASIQNNSDLTQGPARCSAAG